MPTPGPNLEWFKGATKKAISRLDPKSAAGFDGVSAAYIKGASVTVQEGDKVFSRHVLAPLLAELFHLCYGEGVCPGSWKVARLSPLYKNKGPLLAPDSYRMLAVSSVFYRLYANVVRQTATDWCVSAQKVPESQFGFYPGRDTTQAAFILRHVVQAVKFAASQAGGQSANRRVYCAFMDFTQAYDRIDRKKLWLHLESIGMPQHLLRAVQGMYDGDTYILMDGGRQTPPIQPTQGVKQGCPLSPLLFSLYINDFAAHAPSLSMHGVTLGAGGSGRKVSHVFYADDLGLMSFTEAGLNAMLSDLHRYARLKGLTVNATKSEVVVFGTRNIPVRRPNGAGDVEFLYGGARLAVKPDFKYLGLLFCNSLSMGKMQEQRARGLMAAIRQVGTLGRSLGLHRSPWAMVKLFQTYATSAGMYGSQLWGSKYLQMDKVWDSDISKRHIRFIKRQLGVPYTVSNWTAMCEANVRPFHYYWVRAACRFQARLLDSNSPLLVDVAKADAALASDGAGDCWSAEFGRALESIGVKADDAELGRVWCDQAFSATGVNAGSVLSSLEKAYELSAWEGIGQVPDVREYMRAHQGDAGRRSKRVVYHSWFKLKESGWPAYLSGLPNKEQQHMMHQVARFRLSAHRLQVELGRRTGTIWESRHCTRCLQHSGEHHVDDEQHMIFECPTFEDLRHSVDGARDLIGAASGCVRSFMSGDTSVVASFISGCLDRVDAEALPLIHHNNA
jgi:hypothetical protein